MRLRLVPLAAVLALAGCEAAPHTAPTSASLPHVVDGGGFDSCGASVDSVVLSERGIGGTGGAASLADRGIGGTGLTTRSLTHGHGAAPGIGIVGVVGGLPDLCVDGVRIALDGPTRIVVDGEARTSETLRAGQVAAVEASGPADALHAVRIEIRHEVAGPITAASRDSVEVMGQHVTLSARTRLAADLRVGAWVAVSGLRDPNGVIHASRVDARTPGDAVAFAENPPVRADGSLRRLLVEGYPVVAGNKVTVGAGVEAEIGPAFGQAPPPAVPVVVELDSSAGALVAVSWHAAGSGGGPQ